RVAAEIVSQRAAGAEDLRAVRSGKDGILQVRSALRRAGLDARSSQAQTEVGVARIGLVLREQLVPLCAHVGERKDGAGAEFTLDRKIEMLAVRQLVSRLISGRTGNRQEDGPIQILDAGGTRHRENEWEPLCLRRA